MLKVILIRTGCGSCSRCKREYTRPYDGLRCRTNKPKTYLQILISRCSRKHVQQLKRTT